MKKYLSSYWKRSCLFCVFIIVATIVTTAIFCSWSSDKEDYILINMQFTIDFDNQNWTKLKDIRINKSKIKGYEI